MPRALTLLALLLALTTRAHAQNVVEFKARGGLLTLLGHLDQGPSGLVLPTELGLGLRLSPTWRVGAMGGLGLTGLFAEAQADHSLRGFATNGPFFRVALGLSALPIRCDADCASLHPNEVPFGLGPHLSLGVAWRWSFPDDEGGVSVGASVLGALLESKRSAVSRLYSGASGPWLEIDW